MIFILSGTDSFLIFDNQYSMEDTCKNLKNFKMSQMDSNLKKLEISTQTLKTKCGSDYLKGLNN